MSANQPLITNKICFQRTIYQSVKQFLSIYTQRQKIVKVLIFFLLFSFYICYSYITYINYQKNTQARLQKTAKALEDIISDIFNNYSLLMRYMGSRIAEHDDPNDLEFINKILHSVNNKDYNVKSILSWSLIHWISQDDKILVDHSGILKKSDIKTVVREYLPKAKEKPWCIHISEPDIGSISHIWVIPVGLGITDKNGKHLGLLSTGFSITSLNNILDEKLDKESTSFVILDTQSNIVLKSPDNSLSDRSGYYKNLLKNFTGFSKSEDHMQKPIKQDNMEYSYYKKMDNYPYIILTGQDIEVARRRWFNTCISIFSELFCVTIILLTILYLYHKKYTETARAANKAKHEIIQKTIQQFNFDIDLICQYSDILLKSFNDELKIEIDESQQLEMALKIQESAKSLQKFSVLNFDKKLVNINTLINEVITVYSHDAFIRNIKIKEEIENDSLNFYANELSLKQILIGLISHRLKTISAGGYLKIKAFINTENYTDFLYIILADDGLILNNESAKQQQSKIRIEKDETDIGLFHFDINTVFNLIKLHNGSYVIDNSNFKEKMLTVKFTHTANPLVQIKTPLEKYHYH